MSALTTWQSRKRFWAAFVWAGFVILGTLPAQTACALEVEQILWGFDESCVPQKFNPVSILISNPSDEPFEGTLELTKSRGAQRFGARLIEEGVYISAYSDRWVQFYPFVNSNFEEWQLAWRQNGRQSVELPQPRAGDPARVVLTDADTLISRGGGMKSFPSQLFPPMVTATDALELLVIDHAPRWEPSRRIALRDWLHRGGTLHLLHDVDGNFPTFPADLNELNAPLDTFAVGAGTVHRHAITRRELTGATVNELILKGKATRAASVDQATPADPTGPQVDTINEWEDVLFYDRAIGFFGQLRQMTKPNHSWSIIYLMACVYILMVFPGCYVLGVLRLDYRIVYLSLIGVVVMFSLGFSVVGRRGYDEVTAVHSVSIAKPLPGGHYDVTAWSNVFVTTGDDYAIEHNGTGGLYSTAQSTEAVNGYIDNGGNSRFVVDIPPYSSRSFAHRVKVKSTPLEINVVQWQADDTLQRFEIEAGTPLDELSSNVPVYALYRDRLYRLLAEGTHARLASPNGSSLTSLAAFVSSIESNSYGQYGWGWQYDTQPVEERFRNMHAALLATQLDIERKSTAQTFSLPDDRVRVFLYGPTPESMKIANDRLGMQTGYVLYAIDVLKPENQ